MEDPVPSKKTPVVSQQTTDRRTWLEWVGKAAVLSLGTAALASCFPDAEGFQGGDGGEGDGGSGGGDGAFQPGSEDHSVYRGWGERTVDRQDLESILGSWQLTLDGMVEEPRRFTFADLLSLQRQEQVTDFHCVEGWSIQDVPWNGVHLNTLLPLARPRGGATHITFHTIHGAYNESLPLPVALEPRTLLAYGIAGSTLPLKHGFPLRLVVPRLLAYKSAKYVERLELTDHPVEGYWVARGYDYDAEVPASRLRPGKY